MILWGVYAPRFYSKAMRLTPEQRRVIVTAVRHAFGDDARIRLFGSRVDDGRKGGDFDLYIETAMDDPDRIVGARLALLCELDATPALEGEKVDVVLRTPLHEQERGIDRVARRQGVLL